ncbi:DUF7159 family protein [Mycolicibacterium cosmeticum]|uniref:DUF7159 family protein n=1 Tax=Mycolicibacterium cosmeticum TaxID=258533 RepID=UPI003D161C8B
MLGLSMTPTSLGLVVVGGADEADGDSAGDAFALPVDDGTDVRAAAQQVTAAVEAISAARRLKSIGVTWSEDAGAEAAMLMDSLSASGFGNVVPIRLPEATEALARGMADVIGYRTTAVCVIEPDTVIALIVHRGYGGVQTAINHGIDSDESLIGWLSTVFIRADWQPEALVVVGSAGDFGAVLPRLEDALSVPVFAPDEAPLALARGAALASTHSLDMPFDETALMSAGAGRHAAARRVSPAGALTGVLAAGVVTFVVSASAAVAVALSPEPAVAAPRPVAASAAIPEVAVPEAAPVIAPPPAAAPAPEAVPAVDVPQAPVEAATEPPAAAPADIADAAPPAEASPEPPAAPVDTAPPLSFDGGVAAAVPPPAIVPQAPPPVAPPVKKSLLDRIRDRLHPGADDDYPTPVLPAPQG